MGSSPELQSDQEAMVDLRLLQHMAGFVLRSWRRHTWVALAVFLSVIFVSILAILIKPKTYRTETKILAEPNFIMANLTNPGRSIPSASDSPTRSAAEIILKHDNLVALVKQVNLLDEWQHTRTPLLKIKDEIITRLTGPASEQDRLERLIGLLSSRLQVTTDQGTVTIGLTWPHAEQVFRIVSAAQENFLEARHAEEVSSIAETITILEEHATTIRNSIESTLAEINRPHTDGASKENTKPNADTLKSAAIARERSQLRTMIMAKQKAISDLEDFRNRRIAELQAQLTEQSATYAPAHPALTNLKQSIAAMSVESPQIAALRQQEQELTQSYTKLGGKALTVENKEIDGATPNWNLKPLPIEALRHSQSIANGADDENAAYQHARIHVAVNAYEELIERIEAARIELDTTRAAFKYRYSIVTPPEIPKKPEKAPFTVLLGGIIAAFFLSMFSCAVFDVLSGRILEAWQIPQYLGLPVLAELDQQVQPTALAPP